MTRLACHRGNPIFDVVRVVTFVFFYVFFINYTKVLSEKSCQTDRGWSTNIFHYGPNTGMSKKSQLFHCEIPILRHGERVSKEPLIFLALLIKKTCFKITNVTPKPLKRTLNEPMSQKSLSDERKSK